MDLYTILTHLRPRFDAVLVDDGDGPYIYNWSDPRPQPTPEEIAAAWPEVQRSQILAAIDAHASALRGHATAGIHPAEMASWPIKRAEALTYAGDPSACPMLTTEAQARGITLEAIVARVKANALALAQLEAAIAGVCGRHKDAVRQAEDPAAYDWSAGWPL